MAPTEAPHMVQRLQVQNSCLSVLDDETAHIDFLGFGVDVGEELPVRQWTVGTEFVEDLGERG